MATRPQIAFGVAGSLLAAVGCSGSMSTQRLSDGAMNDTQEEIKGVVFYQPALFAETTVKTAYVRDGTYIGRSTDGSPACSEVASERVVTLPDLTKPYSIRYHAGLFETSTFGVTLKDGMLAAVNAAPAAAAAPQLPLPAPPLGGTLTPLGIPATAAPAAPAWGFRQAQLPAGLPACNDGPVITGYRRLSIP